MNKKELLVKTHAYIASDGGIYTYKCKDIHGKRLRVRRRLRVKFYNKEEKLINDFINTFKILYPNIKSIRYYKKRLEVEIRNDFFAKEILEIGKVWSSNWEFPKDINTKQKRIWIRAFADCDGTVNDYNYTRYVAIDSINLNGLKQISLTLDEFGISSRIIEVRYKDKITYRLKISRRDNLIRFNELIGFNHPLKKKKLNEAIKSYKRTF